ncbi:MAG: type II secretion system F family protein [Dehalococcoidia bacterium]|nr:type II secretion system F family protein [Dehalococcoidia bacterium]
MQLAFLMPLAIFGGVVLGAMALNSLLVRQPRSVRERIERYEAREKEASGSQEEASLLKDQRFSAIGWLNQLLQNTNFAERVALDLARAAMPLRVSEYILVRWLCGMFLMLLAMVLGLPWPIALAAGVIGFFVPKFYINFQRQKRVNKIVGQLMDAISLIANSLKSGYSFNQGLDLVSREMPHPIADEFQQVLGELNMGGSAEEALNNLTKRVPSVDIDLMVTAFLIQRQVGGNLAEVLDNIAHTIRERIRILGEVRTRTSQARLSGYVVGLMPFFLMGVISLLSPSYMNEMFSSPLGITLLGVAFGMELVGFVLIKRIAAIEV